MYKMGQVLLDKGNNSMIKAEKPRSNVRVPYIDSIELGERHWK